MFPNEKFSTRASTTTAGFGASVNIPQTPMTVLSANVMSTSRLDPKLSDKIESFLSKIKRRKFIPKQEESMSLVVAREATDLLKDVVDHYSRNAARSSEDQLIQEESELSFHLGKHKKEYRQRIYEVTQEVIGQVSQAGRQLQRTTAFKILLANATRRVLAILRNALVTATITEQEFDRHYAQLLEVAKENRKARKAALSPQGKSTGIDGGDLMESDEDNDDILEDSEDEADAEEWGFSKPAGNRSFGGMELNSDGMPVGTPPTDGHTLPRVSSTAGLELQKARSKLRKPISLATFYDTANDQIQELVCEEYDGMTAQLCAHASLHVYGGELLVVYGCSHSTMSFLLAATEGKNFLVLILEGAPQKGASTLAAALTERGIGCRIVPDSSCFAVMSRASKVIVGAEAVLANGGLLAPIGTHMVCMAAQHHAVPVVVVTMSLKLCPYYPSDRHCSGLVKISRHEAKEMPWSTYGSPHDVLPLDAWARGSDERNNQLQVHNPVMEYCPPDLVSLFVTDIGEYPPEDINRVVRDQYNAEDTHL